MRAATLDDVRTFFQTYYHPGNASLTLAGDIDTERAFELAERFFGELARRRPPWRRSSELRRSHTAANLLLEDRVELPRLYLAGTRRRCSPPTTRSWISPADVLAHGKTSRLYSSLVYERRVATDVSALPAVARDGRPSSRSRARRRPASGLPELEAAVRDAVRSSRRAGPTESELERALAQTEAQFVYRLQTIGGFGGKSDQLNAYNVYLGDPGYFDRDRQRYVAVTDVRGGHGRWTPPRSMRRSITLSVVPRGGASWGCPAPTRSSVS